MPLVGDAAGRQQQREVRRSGVSAGSRVRRGGEARAAVGRREAAVGVEALGAAALALAGRAAGAGPLQAALLAQARVRDAAQVARPPGGAGGELVEDGGGVGARRTASP